MLEPDDPEIMPPKGDPLSSSEIDMLKQWIKEGAKENPSDKFIAPTKEEDAATPMVDIPRAAKALLIHWLNA